MQKFIPKEKLSKEARHALNSARRQTWGDISPVTRKTESKKRYNRKKSDYRFDDHGSRIFVYMAA